ncbi:beta transducin het-e4s protein [Rutstroemia sp. NJR-2017a BBW]|nr:beta transducin het-e4s protein [Rutstroemia sp. NJR-2017a BBW]
MRCSYIVLNKLVPDDDIAWECHRIRILYKNQGKLVEAEQMYQRALQGYEKALGTDNIITYVPALNTIWNLGSLFELQADLAKAGTMYSKASLGYEQVFGPEHPESQSSRRKLYALDAVMKNRALKSLWITWKKNHRILQKLPLHQNGTDCFESLA